MLFYQIRYKKPVSKSAQKVRCTVEESVPYVTEFKTRPVNTQKNQATRFSFNTLYTPSERILATNA